MALPVGTVTLLFSDMEGSTRLLDRLGGRYAAALEQQRTILRQAWQDFGGTELGTEGDSFFVAFPDAPSAVSAAVQAQRQVGAAEWPEGERVTVRMGIHTGSPVVHDDGYVGMDVHRAARVASSAYGGQVLVTDATRALANAAGVDFLDLGLHSLKDLPQRERLFQVLAPGLATDFPPVRGLGSTAGLPTPATPLVGRDETLDELGGLLAETQVRLVTLTGPGGSGKTRLAIALAAMTADRYTQGAFFVPLESVTTPDVMWTAIATVLGVPPEGRLPPGLFDHISQRSALLVLDNLEQVQSAGEVVRELLSAAPGIRVVGTSRVPLHVTGEQEFPVPPLALPLDDGDAAESSSAVQLFVSSARRVRPSFELTADNRAAVVELCRRLDGLPLGLELVAARLKLLSPHALLSRLGQALDLRSPDASRPGRQQTLRQTIGWSHDLLDAEEQRLFRCLSVFAGNADLEAVESVWRAVDSGGTDAVDLVQRLVDASLVVVTDGDQDEPRVGMLNTVAAFAAEMLAGSADEQVAHEAAVRHFDGLLQTLMEDRGHRWRERLTARLEEERQNYRASLTWLLAHLDEASEREHRLTTALQVTYGFSFWFLTIRGYYAEAFRWLEEVTAAAGDRRGLRAAVCAAHLAMSKMMMGDVEAGGELAEEANERAQDEQVDADLPPHTAGDMRFIVKNSLVQRRDVAEDYAAALELTTALLERTRDPLFQAVALMNMARYQDLLGRPEAGLPFLDEAARLAEAAGDALIEIDARHNAAATQRLLGRADRAEREFRDVFAAMLALRSPISELTFGEDYAAVLAELDRPADSALVFGAADAMRERLGVPREKAQEQELAAPAEAARGALGDEQWSRRFAEGRGLTVERAVRQVM